MSKKIAIEARILTWFEEAPIDHATMLLGIVRAKVKARTPALPKPTRKARKPNAKPAAIGQSTSFDPDKIVGVSQ